MLNNNSIKTYLLFLKYVLNFFNNLNAFFQSRKILIHKLFNTSQQLIRRIGCNFLTSETLKDIFTLNVDIEKNIKNLIDIYVRPECEDFFGNTICRMRTRNSINMFKLLKDGT